jgi:dTDP-4-amino-4,6-dideoxygalactose transaminase
VSRAPASELCNEAVRVPGELDDRAGYAPRPEHTLARMTYVQYEGASATLKPTRAGAPRVPFLDLNVIHAPIKDAILADIADLIDRSAFSNGPAVADFELAFGRYCGSRFAVGVASGLDALRLALIAAGLESGEEVIVPASTFIATVEAVSQAGGRPLLVDIGEEDYNIDVAAVAAAVGPETRAVLPVHLYGQMADMQSLTQLSAARELLVIEDACQAHGARRDGIHAGTAGHAGAFSFYPGKNLGAMGDAGALVSDDGALAERVRALREHGQRRKYHHDECGYTSRLDAMQALVLLHKLRRLDSWNDARRQAARHYVDALAGVGDLVLPPVAPGSEPVWHLFVVRTAAPESMATFLRERGIATGRHYPQPIHVTDAYRGLGYRAGTFPVAEKVAREALSLPMFPGITELQLEVVLDAVREYFDSGRRQT